MFLKDAILNAFLSNLPERVRAYWAEDTELSAWLFSRYTAAQSNWPGVSLAPEIFAAHLASHVDPEATPTTAMDGTCTEGLYLAAACLCQEPRAIKAFERECLSQLPRLLAHMKLDPDMVRDLQQELRARLLVAHESEPPKLAHYAGRGALERWVYASAVRLALKWLDKAENRKKVTGADEGRILDGLVHAGAVLGPDSPETAYLKGAYREVAQAALRTAFQTLDQDQRNLFRLHYLDGLSLEKIGGLFGLHKATISRRLASTRELLIQSVRHELRERLGVSESVLESLLRQLQSQLELSISGLMRE